MMHAGCPCCMQEPTGRQGHACSLPITAGLLASHHGQQLRTAVCMILCMQVADMIAVLSLAGSSYLGPFLERKEQIQQEAVAAESNVTYLTCLEAPCQQLSKAKPPEIPALLPQILDCIRMVWSLSQFYNTPEPICSLLRMLSNEVINRCCAALQLGDIFTGDVLTPMEQLQQSMAAGESCKG